MYKRQPVVNHQGLIANAAIVVSDKFLSQVSAVISNPINKHSPILSPRINNRIISRLMICLKYSSLPSSPLQSKNWGKPWLATYKRLLYEVQKVLACSTLFLFFISFTTQLQVAFKWLKSSCLPAFSYSFLIAEEHLPKMMLSTRPAWAGTAVIAATAAQAITPDHRDIEISELLASWQGWPADM